MTWWGAHALRAGQAGQWRVGPLLCVVTRREREWWIRGEQGDDPLDPRVEVSCPIEAPDSDGGKVVRFADVRARGEIRLVPVLADRPVVTRPDPPLTILPQETAELFVTSPIWVRFEIGQPPIPVHEMPAYRPSDTWFGPTKMEGELCYAARTSADLKYEDVATTPSRAVTKVSLRNRGKELLLLERLKLPVPHLSLFRDATGALWTETVNVQADAAGPVVEVRLTREPPAEVRSPSHVSPARSPEPRNLLVRALSAFLG